MTDFALEIGTEDLPPKQITPALRQLQEEFERQLGEKRITFDSIRVWGTPRRLIVTGSNLARRQKAATRHVRGPALSTAYDSEGRPTKAATGFAKTHGVDVSTLRKVGERNKQYVIALIHESGRPTSTVLSEIIQQSVRSVRFSKTMRWGAQGERFARPVRWILALFGSAVVDVELFGIKAGRYTYGHRTLAPNRYRVDKAQRLLVVLRQAKIVVRDDERRKIIEEQCKGLASEVNGLPILDLGLLEETVMSLEHPQAMRGEFSRAHSTLPKEVLTTVMQHHQKYFPVEGIDGRLLSYFVAVRDGGKSHLTEISRAHEWVLEARLADAKFFFTQDRQTPLEGFLPRLDGMTFHSGLGTYGDKQRRLVAISRDLAQVLGMTGVGADDLLRAASLAKADLVTHLVGEFPELQGVAGGIYAALDGESSAVAAGIREHYKPSWSGDSPPKTQIGALAGLIDKCDTLVAMLSVGTVPKGSEDPYGLRRAAQGIVEVLLHHMLRIDMRKFLLRVFEVIKPQLTVWVEVPTEWGKAPEPVVLALDLVRQRHRTTLIENGVRYDLVDAALAVSNGDIVRDTESARALQKQARSGGLVQIYFAYERAFRIVTEEASNLVDPSAFESEAERELYHSVQAVQPSVEAAAEAVDFTRAMGYLGTLAKPVSRIFDDVLIMAPDPRVRANRLALLREAAATFRLVADFSKIVMTDEQKQLALGARE